jgi:hypothetical protein
MQNYLGKTDKEHVNAAEGSLELVVIVVTFRAAAPSRG